MRKSSSSTNSASNAILPPAAPAAIVPVDAPLLLESGNVVSVLRAAATVMVNPQYAVLLL